MEYNSYYDVKRYDNNYETYNPRRYRAGIKTLPSVASSASTKPSTGHVSSGYRSSIAMSTSSSKVSPGSVEEIFTYETADGKLYRHTIHIKNVTPFRSDGTKAKLKYEQKIVKSEIIDSSQSFECIVCGLEDEGLQLSKQVMMMKMKGEDVNMNMTIAKYDSLLKTVTTLQKVYPKNHEKVYMLVRFITDSLRKALELPDEDQSLFTKYYIDNYPEIIPDGWRSRLMSGFKDSANALEGYITISYCDKACIVIGEENVAGGYITHHITGGFDRIDYERDYSRGGYDRDYYSRGGYDRDYHSYDRDYYSRGGYNRDYHSYDRDYYSRGGYDRDYHSRDRYDRDYHSSSRDYYPNSMHGGALGEFRKEINRDIYKSLRDDILNMQLD